MITKQENEWSEPYLRTNLSAKDHERLAAELRADPHLLGKLLQLKTPQDEEQSAALLFGDPNVPNQDVLDVNIRKYLLRDPNFTRPLTQSLLTIRALNQVFKNFICVSPTL